MSKPIDTSRPWQADTKIAEIGLRVLRGLGWVVVSPVVLVGAVPGSLMRLSVSFFKRESVFKNPAIHPPRSFPSNKLSVCTFNVCLGPEFITANSTLLETTAARVKKVAHEILKTRDEVVCLQEIFSETAAEELSILLGDVYPYQIYNVAPKRLGLNGGLAIFSQRPLQNPSYWKYTTGAGVCRHANKGVLVCTVIMDHQTKAIVSNTHLTSFPECYVKGASQARIIQMRELTTHIKNYIQKNRIENQNLFGVFQCGDYNCGPKLYPQIWPEWNEIQKGQTDFADQSYPVSMHGHLNSRIDHILIQKPAENLSGNETLDEMNYVSDHLAVRGIYIKWN